jgi:hypothetical protein
LLSTAAGIQVPAVPREPDALIDRFAKIVAVRAIHRNAGQVSSFLGRKHPVFRILFLSGATILPETSSTERT